MGEGDEIREYTDIIEIRFAFFFFLFLWISGLVFFFFIEIPLMKVSLSKSTVQF